MVAQDADDVGIELFDYQDFEAFKEEIESTDKEDVLDEIENSWDVMFSENINHIQHELLELSSNDYMQYEDQFTSLSREQLVETARNFARTAFRQFANLHVQELGEDYQVSFSDIPDDEDDLFDFREAIVDGMWESVEEQQDQY